VLNDAYNTLLKESGSETRCPLSMALESTVMPWNNLSASEAEITAIFCICVLAEIGNAKNNIIGVCFSHFVTHGFVSLASHSNGLVYLMCCMSVCDIVLLRLTA